MDAENLASTPLYVLMASADRFVMDSAALADQGDPTLFATEKATQRVGVRGELALDFTDLYTFRVPELAELLRRVQEGNPVGFVRSALRAAVATEGRIEVRPETIMGLLHSAPLLTRDELNRRWSGWSPEQRVRYNRLREGTLANWFPFASLTHTSTRMAIASWAAAAADALL